MENLILGLVFGLLVGGLIGGWISWELRGYADRHADNRIYPYRK